MTAFHAIALDAGGRVVVAGSALARGSGAAIPCVARFSTDGRRDRHFERAPAAECGAVL